MPRIEEKTSEMDGVPAIAKAMAVAARTVPKTRGLDAVETVIVYDFSALLQSIYPH